MNRFFVWFKYIAFCSLLYSSQVFSDEKSDMEKLQKDIAALQKELKSVQGARSGLQKELEKSETQINDLEKKAEDIKKELNKQHQDLDDLKQERTQLEQQRTSQQEKIAAQILAAYKLGQQSDVKLLLNQESPDKVSRLMSYHGYFVLAQQRKVETYRDTINKIDSITPDIEKKTLELASIQSQLDSQRTALGSAHKERQIALNKVNSQIKNKQQELTQLNEDRQKLQVLLSRVTRKIASSGAINSPAYVPLPKGGEKFSVRKGRLLWPTKGKMIHRFGSPRIAGQLNWSGAYIASEPGNKVIAVHHGRVVFADYFGGHGLLIIVDHGEGFLSLYAHNQSLLKKAGDPVTAGESIAIIGNSGGQSSIGVYFEIRRDGKPIDPSTWLAPG
jgi:murein hydrolase activator